MGLTSAQRERARAVFKKIDTDNSGAVDFEELGSLVSDVEERRTMMVILDADCNLTVTQEEWLMYLATKREDEGEEWFADFLRYVERVANKAATEAASSHNATPEESSKAGHHDGAEDATAQPFVGSPRSLSGLRAGTSRVEKLEAIFSWIAGLEPPYGTIDIHTLHEVASLKNELTPGRKKPMWTEDKTMSLALKMKVDKGIIEKEGFVEYYQKRFDGRDDESFMEEVDLLLEVSEEQQLVAPYPHHYVMKTVGSQTHRQHSVGGKIGATGDDIYHHIVVRNNRLEVRGRLWVALNTWVAWYEAMTATRRSLSRMFKHRQFKAWNKWSAVHRNLAYTDGALRAVHHALLHWMQREIAKSWHTWAYFYRGVRSCHTATIFYRYHHEVMAFRKWSSKAHQIDPIKNKLRFWVHFSARRSLPVVFKQWRRFANNWTVAHGSVLWGAASWRTEVLKCSIKLWRIVAEYMTQRYVQDDFKEMEQQEWDPDDF